MPSARLFTGPTLSGLETRVFEELKEDVSSHPMSLLYLAPEDHAQDPTRERWKAVGSSAALRIDTLAGIVTDAYERDQYKSRVTHIDRPLLIRLVELGVEGIETSTNPLCPEERFPRAGLVQQAQRLFINLEYAGLLSPEAMRERLDREDVSDRATHVEELAQSIETAREAILVERLPETYPTERMHHVTTQPVPLADVLPAVDAVVISGFTRFDAIERNFLKQIIDTWPTVALCPLQADTETVAGVDRGAEQALKTYRDLGFVREFSNETGSAFVDARRRITRSLYRHSEQSPKTTDIDASDLALTVREPETVPGEIRMIARDIRSRLATTTDPGDIGVVLTSPVKYADQVQEVFDTYEFPFVLDTETPLPDTALGDAVQTVCELAREPRTIDSLMHLLTNPLVTVAHGDGRLDHRDLTHVAARVETNRLDSTLEHADDAIAATIESLLRDMEALTDAPLDDLPGQLDALLDRFGVLAALDEERDLSDSLRGREQSAGKRLDRVLETLALTEPVADRSIGDSIDRLERALHGVSIQDTGQAAEDSVIVCGLSEVTARDFGHVYILGLTATHVPSNPERSAFAQPIYDAHPDFEQADMPAEARYHLGTLLASEASLELSIPQRSQNGDPYIEADIVTELRRLLDLDDITIDTPDVAPGCVEDVQRAIGDVLSDAPTDRAQNLVERAGEAGTFDPAQRTRINAGMACGAARASPQLTPYDGQLSAEMVSRVHDQLDREPYSPSRLETYAACGFKYYMRQVLGIEAPESLTREPDAGARGSYIHDVLEHYYLSLQGEDGEPIHPGGDFATRQERLLDVALDRLAGAFTEYDETAFQAEWLTEVLAGLGTPDTNRYYGPPADTESGRPVARGLFYQFLEHEFDEPAKTTARPTWFEARIGNPYETGTPIQSEPAEIETPQGTVPIHGLIDRVETVPGTAPEQIVVRDYKTGSTIPSGSDALLGLKFQLPLYGLMAEDAFDAVETVGGAYYQVSPPDSVNSRRGLLTSQDMAVYHGNDDVSTPLLRHSYPYFETHAAFRRFIEETTPRRLGTLATAISEGRFQPTVLDPSDAGCRYCDYAHVCDVRSHQRRAVIDRIDADDIDAYVPPKAREQDIEDVVEAE
ncbi:MAG: PD-(D/E)XK nuclease family protein [Halobacteriales archaeon]